MALVAVSAISLLAASSVFGYIIRSSLWRAPSPEGAERARPLSADVFPASWTSTFNTTRGQKDVSFMRSIAQRRGMSLWAVRHGSLRTRLMRACGLALGGLCRQDSAGGGGTGSA